MKDEQNILESMGISWVVSAMKNVRISVLICTTVAEWRSARRTATYTPNAFAIVVFVLWHLRP